jgi:LCP family protein required for cell wall assembly
MRQNQSRKPRYRIRWGRLLLVCFVFLLGTGIAAAGVLYYYLDSFQSRTTSSKDPQVTEAKTYAQVSGRVNILALGVDDGEYGSKEELPKRSDTLMLISIDPATNSANILSIPRDTAVNIPSRKGTEKIAHAHAYGGPELAVRTVSQLLGVPIHYYVEADFAGFEEIVDVLGGVDLYVEHNMKYEDPYADLKINLRQGFQHLDGDKAGQYVRFRHDELGDIGRVQRQQKFVQAVADKVMQPSTVFKIPTLAGTIKQYMRTDMSAVQMLRVANAVKGLKRENIHTEMLPGNFGDINKVSYWIMDKEETKRLVKKMFKDPGEELADSSDVPNSANSM